MAEKIKLTDICRKLGRICLYLFLFDCAATGAGRYVKVGPLTPRILLAALIVLFASVPFFTSIEEQIRNPVNWIVLIFMCYVIFEVFRGQAFGNNQEVLASDVKGFIYMLLIPAVPVLVTEKKYLRRAADAVIAGCFVHAAFSIICNACFADLATNLYRKIVNWASATGWGKIQYYKYNAYRIFGRSCIWLIVGCALLLRRIVKAEKARAVCGWGFLFLLNAEAIVLTYTRSVYLATAVAFVLALILCLKTAPVKKVLLRTGALLVLLVVMIYGQELALKQGVFQFAFIRCFNYDLDAHFHIPHTWARAKKVTTPITSSSDDIRVNTTDGLIEIIKEYPLIGRGLGATSPTRDGADEYFYIDMLARTGVVGLTLYLLPIALALIRLLKRRKALKEYPEPGLIMISLIAFLVATYFNPWMNSSLGIACYALAVAAVWTLPEIKEGTDEQCAES